MTIVLVHGNPETDVIWDPLVYAIQREDVVRLSPPGFGAALDDGFPTTYLAYRDWLEGTLEGFDKPIDVVGHDWGGGHLINALMNRPELVLATSQMTARRRIYIWPRRRYLLPKPHGQKTFVRCCWTGKS